MTAAEPGWVRYWFLSDEKPWPYHSVSIDSREVPSGGQVLITALGFDPSAAATFELRVDPAQIDQFATQWLEFREVTR